MKTNNMKTNNMKTNNMKTKGIFFVMAILTIGIGFSSCKKEKVENKDDKDLYFNVKMDGESFSGEIGDGKTVYRSHGETLLTIKDKAGNNPGFFINIINYTGAKTYELSANATSEGNASNASYSESLSSVKWTYWSSTTTTPGTITILSDKNNVVEGTFSFDGYNPDDSTTKIFTEGKFRLKVNP